MNADYYTTADLKGLISVAQTAYLAAECLWEERRNVMEGRNENPVNP